TLNRDCVAIIIAAGETKAPVVAAAVQSEKSVLHPATALQVLPNARFYVTVAAASLLSAREYERLSRFEEIPAREQDQILVDLAVKQQKGILELTEQDFQADAFARLLAAKTRRPVAELVQSVHERLRTAIARGSQVLTKTCFLHTEPHHDDIMLGYLPSIVRHVREPSNTHHFITLTSGFNAVTNAYLSYKLKKLAPRLGSPDFLGLNAENYFAPDDETGRQRDVWQFLDGVAAKRPRMIEEGFCRRLLRDLFRVYGKQELDAFRGNIHDLVEYLDNEYPGKKDPEHIQRLKGKCREWEAECLWGYLGWNCSHVKHLRLGFYTGDIFTEEPTQERDVPPILQALTEVNPDIITVALDPEGSGPDTHYKVLQAITAAVQKYVKQTGRKDLKIWGYRNVWYRFHPAEANLYVPVSLNMFAIMENAFLNTFVSQRDASFPSYAHDGPFCELAQSIQVEQYQTLKTCLGRRWFHEHPSPMMRAARGMVFLKEMALEEFFAISRELQKKTESL
ncbi:MAG: PIG-L family deacetylase, partial [Planctomycetes bacterium]|nr:PIG-L family deacetylase [Planctomycetota bacterium]